MNMKTQAISAQPQAARMSVPAPNACWRFLSKLFREKRLGAMGAVVAMVFLFVGLFADVLAPYGMNEVDMGARLQAPSWAHPFGTDNLGRDLLSRCMYGAQISVIIGLTVAAISTVISALIGIISGYFGGKVDLVIQRFVDAWMSFPDLVILIVVVSVLGPGMWQVIVVLGFLYGIGGSRIIRGAVISVRENTYVHAAQSIGAPTARVLIFHVLPNVMPTVIVLFTMRVGAVILVEAGLSFLGLGIPPPAPSWGGMLTGSGRTFMYLAPWLALAPGICLTLVVYGINMFGDALRDLLDPRLRGGRH